MAQRKTSASRNKGDIFRNCFIHVLPAGLGKKRLTLFQTQISNHGGNLVSKLPASGLTHVVLEDSLVKDVDRCAKLLRSAHVDVNTAVKVVGTQWLSKCLKESSLVDTKEFELPSVKVNVPEAQTSVKNHQSTECNVEEDTSALTAEHSPPKKLKPDITEKYVCSKSSGKPGAEAHCNLLVIAELQKLSDAFRSSGDQWRSYGYEKAISAIKAYGAEITSYEEAKSIPGVGSKIAEKISEFLSSGQLRKVDEICGNERNQVVELFTKVWGAGPTTAQNWFLQGFRTLEDLRSKANLTKQQRIGLKHFEDIQDRMPREEVEEIAAEVKRAALYVEPKLNIELCGSYRRGKTTCGDVDVLITKPDNISTDILVQVTAKLKETGFITDDLVNVEVNRNQKKYLGVCRLPGQGNKHRRLDIFVVPRSEYATALMHYTGSALFNRSIRLLATNKGMSLSEHSLVAGIVRQGRDKLNDGYVVPTPTEESIFKHLELDYRRPEERDH